MNQTYLRANPVPAHILVVDDDAPTVRLIDFLLTSDGYRITTAPNGRLALDFCQRELPDLTLLNVLLPDFDGFEVYQRLLELGYKGPVIFITARPDIPEVLQDRHMDVAGCLVKPLILDEVENIVGRVTSSISGAGLSSVVGF